MFVCGGGEGRVLLCAQRLYYRRDQLDCPPPPNGLNHYLPMNKTGARSTGERFRATMGLFLFFFHSTFFIFCSILWHLNLNKESIRIQKKVYETFLPLFILFAMKVRKGAKIKNRYNHVPHLTQDTNRSVTNAQLDTTNESQEASPFPAGDHKAHINRRAQRHSKRKTENT